MENNIQTFTGIQEQNKSTILEIENYKNMPVSTVARNVTFGALVVGTGFFASLIAVQAITGIVAIVATLGIAAGGFFGLRFLNDMAPAIRQKTKNIRLNAMMKEARVNAIAQLDNQVLFNVEKLKRAKTGRDKMGVLVETLKNKIDYRKKGEPSTDKKIQILERVEKSYDLIKSNLTKAEETHKKFEEKVRNYKDLEKFTALAGEAMSYSQNDSNDKLNEMLSLESFEHIDSEFNLALVNIENNTEDFN